MNPTAYYINTYVNATIRLPAEEQSNHGDLATVIDKGTISNYTYIEGEGWLLLMPNMGEFQENIANEKMATMAGYTYKSSEEINKGISKLAIDI